MSKYAYIAAYQENDSDSLSFCHIFFDAENDDEAYNIGISTIIRSLGTKNIVDNIINDYVINLDEKKSDFEICREVFE